MTLTILAASLPALAGAESFRHGRIRHVEDGVTIQRAAEATAEEAVPNLPFLPGDRVWSDQTGRAEFQFEGGSVLRLDSGSKLDYLNHDDERNGERIVLRLWSGSLYLHVRDRRAPEFEIETPGGLVSARTRGVYRVDSEGGETTLSVLEGEAVLEGTREVRVASGERVVARRGEIEDGPDAFDVNGGDRFADWVQDRQERGSFAGERPAYLPEEVASYAGEFDAHGSWYYEAEVGHVWRPYVASGWRPYWDGRWVWTVYGWTWVPRETWGWAAFHYGRWGCSPTIGWYWIPGRQWGPGWVSWASGGDYLGWSPLGYRDRPVVIRERGRVRGHAIPRSGATRADGGLQGRMGAQDQTGSAWMYVKRSDLASARTLSRVAKFDAPAGELQMVDPTKHRLTKDWSVAEGAALAAPRAVRTKPTITDAVPEMRGYDPAATIPFPAARRRGRENGGYDSHTFGEAAEPSKRAHEGDAADPAVKGSRTEGGDAPVWSAPRSSQPRNGDEGSAWASPRRNRDEGDAGRHRAEPPAAKPQEEREVLRPLFGGLSRPHGDDDNGGARRRGDDGGARARPAEPRGGESAHSAPPQHKQAPPPPPPPPHGEAKKAREKEHH
jgi:hypothetical protein